MKGKEDIVKLLLDCVAEPEDSIWQVFDFIDAQQKMDVAQPSLAILSLLRDAGAHPAYLMLEKSMKPPYLAILEEFLPFLQTGDPAYRWNADEEDLWGGLYPSALEPKLEGIHPAKLWGKGRELEEKLQSLGKEPRDEAVDDGHKNLKAREWDEFREANPRGWGNRMNKG
ncbi:hypothetical protein HK104_004171 [Borealophlyctis nickersoniae]|nr:hypothetical protein HK104_004171 [Borealophlyctis nickersoniae]